MGLPFASVPVPLNRPSVWSAFAACTASSLAANAEGTNETARVSARMKDKNRFILHLPILREIDSFQETMSSKCSITSFHVHFNSF